MDGVARETVGVYELEVVLEYLESGDERKLAVAKRMIDDYGSQLVAHIPQLSPGARYAVRQAGLLGVAGGLTAVALISGASLLFRPSPLALAACGVVAAGCGGVLRALDRNDRRRNIELRRIDERLVRVVDAVDDLRAVGSFIDMLSATTWDDIPPLAERGLLRLLPKIDHDTAEMITPGDWHRLEFILDLELADRYDKLPPSAGATLGIQRTTATSPLGRSAVKVNYYSDTDSWYIDLSERPGVESQEVRDGVSPYLDTGRDLVGIDIDHAGRFLNLSSPNCETLPVRAVA